jgi:hypothetical protein
MTEADRIAKEMFFDPVYMCQGLFPHLFPGRIPWLHRGIWAILTRQTEFLHKYGELDEIVENFIYQREGTWYKVFGWKEGQLVMMLGQNTLLMIPRGFSKTTLAGQAKSLRNILYQLHKVTLYTSASAAHANTQIKNIERELETNPRIHALFGQLKPPHNGPQKWTDSEFETTTGSIMVARGSGGQVRGLNFNGDRPSSVVFDDLEDEESVKTDTQRDATVDWAVKDLFPCLAEMNPRSTITGLATLLHADALPMRLSLLPEWTTVKFGALDAKGQPVWPEMLSLEKIEQKKRSYQLLGKLNAFYMEYFNQVRNDETARFRGDMFQYGSPDEPISTALFCDPAISQKKRADSTVIAAVGIGQKTGRIFVLEIWGKQGATPRETIDNFFRMHIRWACRKAGVEANAYQAALVHIMREEMFRKKHYFEVEAVHHHTKNEERIDGILQPRYASGYIWHRERFPELETQLLDFTPGVEGRHDDYPTAVAGAVALLDPFAAHAIGELDLAQDEFEPLESIGGAP